MGLSFIEWNRKEGETPMPEDFDIPFELPALVPPSTSDAKPLAIEYKLLKRNCEPFLRPDDLELFPTISVAEGFELKFENDCMRIWLNKARNFVQIEAVDSDGEWNVVERYN